jgi:hypothetical protein
MSWPGSAPVCSLWRISTSPFTTVAAIPADFCFSRSLQRDRSGEPVFRAIRFHRPHELVYRGGRFQVRLR